MDKNQVISILNAHLAELKAEYRVKTFGLFGSVARGDHTDKSDIDILVEFEEPIGFFDFIRLETQLGKLLNAPVDLISARAVKPAIRENIHRDLIYVAA